MSMQGCYGWRSARKHGHSMALGTCLEENSDATECRSYHYLYNKRIGLYIFDKPSSAVLSEEH